MAGKEGKKVNQDMYGYATTDVVTEKPDCAEELSS